MYLLRNYITRMCLKRTFVPISRAASARCWASPLSAAAASSRCRSASWIPVVRSLDDAVSHAPSAAACSFSLSDRRRFIPASRSAAPAPFAASLPAIAASRAAKCSSTLWARRHSVSASVSVAASLHRFPLDSRRSASSRSPSAFPSYRAASSPSLIRPLPPPVAGLRLPPAPRLAPPRPASPPPPSPAG